MTAIERYSMMKKTGTDLNYAKTGKSMKKVQGEQAGRSLGWDEPLPEQEDSFLKANTSEQKEDSSETMWWPGSTSFMLGIAALCLTLTAREEIGSVIKIIMYTIIISGFLYVNTKATIVGIVSLTGSIILIFSNLLAWKELSPDAFSDVKPIIVIMFLALALVIRGMIKGIKHTKME